MHFVQALVLSSAIGPPTTLPESCQRVSERAAHALPALHHMVTALTGLRQAKNCRGRGKYQVRASLVHGRGDKTGD